MQPADRPEDGRQGYLGDEPAPWERNEPVQSADRVQPTGREPQQQEGGSVESGADKRRPEPQRDRQPQQRTGGQPDGRRNPNDPARPRPPRKNAAELKMPEQKKDYKDPLEDIEFKINRSEGDEKW